MQNHNDHTIKTSDRILRKIYLSLYFKGCERELETEQNCNILTPTLLAITAFLFRSPGLLNRGPGSPASLGAGFLYRILSPNCLISKLIWSPTLNFLCTELYNSSTSTFFLWASQIVLIQPVHGQGYILIFLDRLHLLFTQVHFLFWQPGRVVGQYTTADEDYMVIYTKLLLYIDLRPGRAVKIGNVPV